jgi:hypothetical protein
MLQHKGPSRRPEDAVRVANRDLEKQGPIYVRCEYKTKIRYQAWRRADFQLRGREGGKLIVENVATGTSAEVDLLENKKGLFHLLSLRHHLFPERRKTDF